MSTPPLPPIFPQSQEEFSEHVAIHQPEWFEYYHRVYSHLEENHATITGLSEKIHQLKSKNNHLEKDQFRKQGIIDYQDEQLQKEKTRCLEAMIQRDQAITASNPKVNTPESSSVTTREPAGLGIPAVPTTTPTNTSQLSERLPDPDKFEGDRKDLRRFTSQIHAKMTVNIDRFPTPQSRMTYVANRLKGEPYSQILPHMDHGTCRMRDYNEILDLLDRAYGDPNRVSNARKELYQLRQTNKEFGSFFAEFQRLALEGGMPEDALSTMLEYAVNRELRGMLLHNPPPTREYHEFAKFLQELENRRCQFDNTPVRLTAKNIAAPVVAPAVTASNPDVMDLSTARRVGTTRRERGECYRCGSKNHLIRDCPHPDNRPLGVRPAYTESSNSARPTSPVSCCSASPDQSTKEVSLA